MHGDPWVHSDIGSSLASKLSIDINGSFGLIAQIEWPDNRREPFWESVKGW